MRRVVLADQLTFNAEYSGWQGDEADVLPGELFCHLSDFPPAIFSLGERIEKSKWDFDRPEVAGLVQGCG
jgi:hypothetical protein